MDTRVALLELKQDESNKRAHEDRAEIKADIANLETKIASLDTKIDELLGIKNKGVGAFWLASTLLGTSLIGAITWIVGLIK
jgi:hypothetical protein